MNKEQLKTLDHVTYRETTAFVHLHTEEGYYITDYNGEDIKEFTASECYYLPIREEYPDFHTIDQSKYDRLTELHDKAIEEARLAEEAKQIKEHEDGVQH